MQGVEGIQGTQGIQGIQYEVHTGYECLTNVSGALTDHYGNNCSNVRLKYKKIKKSSG